MVVCGHCGKSFARDQYYQQHIEAPRNAACLAALQQLPDPEQLEGADGELPRRKRMRKCCTLSEAMFPSDVFVTILGKGATNEEQTMPNWEQTERDMESEDAENSDCSLAHDLGKRMKMMMSSLLLIFGKILMLKKTQRRKLWKT